MGCVMGWVKIDKKQVLQQVEEINLYLLVHIKKISDHKTRLVRTRHTGM